MGPPNGPCLARSTLTWIHWWSWVASANWLTCSCVMVNQSLVPSFSPLAASTSSLLLKTRTGPPRTSGSWQVHELSDALSVPFGRPEGQLRRLRPAQVQVGRMLPGHADAAVQLQVLFGRQHRQVGAVRLGEGHGGLGFGAVASQRISGVARGRPRGAHPGPQIGQAVLDGLERADLPAELVAGQRVLHSGVQAVLGE